MLRTLVVLGLTLFAAGAALAQEASVNPLAQSMVDFRKRVDEYMKLRGELTKKIPKVEETGDPAKISSREKALGEAIVAARPAARPGDIFGEEMSLHLRKVLAEDWKLRSPADRKALFEEVPKDLQLKVNQVYPTTLPLVSAPARLLANLPMLPEELEYRLVDRYFLLRDRDANLIIDVLTDVRPRREK